MEIPNIELSNGVEIPQLGLGTWQLKGKDCLNAVPKALDMGYNHVDTADIYGNHEEIGQVLEDYNREELFITSKLWRTDMSKQDALDACERALDELGTTYLDLYLIHWPNRNVPFKETFEALEELYRKEKIRAVGVSNFTINHLKDAMNVSDVPIVMNQVEFHPFLYQKDLLEFCHDNDIHVTAYSPIARGEVIGNEVLEEIGRKYSKTSCQVALRWLVQHGLVAIPKSGTEEHIRENMEIFDFELGDEDMVRIDDLDEQKRLIDPAFAEFSY